MEIASIDVSYNGHAHWSSAIIIALDFSLITGRFFPAALAFGFIEYLLNSPQTGVAVALATSLLESTVPRLESAGFQTLVFEDFYEVLLSLIQQILVPEPGGTTLTSETLLEAFQSPEGEPRSVTPRVEWT